MGINRGLERKRFDKTQKKLLEIYVEAGMTDEQIQAISEFDLNQFNRDLAFQRYNQPLSCIEEPEMDEESYSPLLRKFPERLAIWQKPSESSKHLLYDNPTKRISGKGGVPKKEKKALTDQQVEQLLDAIRGLPPYVFVMIGLYAGLRREEILALQWDCVFLDGDTPYISVRRAWHAEHNKPVILDELKTKAARREIPIPDCLAECLREAKANSKSDFVVANRDGGPLTYTQFVRVWKYITTRSTKERTYVRYVNGQRIKHTVKPVLGEKAAHNNTVVYSMDFQVTPHQLRHTYITNLIYAAVDPKTVQYLAGHENSKITMDIYAKVKYNRPQELAAVVNGAFNKG